MTLNKLFSYVYGETKLWYKNGYTLWTHWDLQKGVFAHDTSSHIQNAGSTALAQQNLQRPLNDTAMFLVSQKFCWNICH